VRLDRVYLLPLISTTARLKLRVTLSPILKIPKFVGIPIRPLPLLSGVRGALRFIFGDTPHRHGFHVRLEKKMESIWIARGIYAVLLSTEYWVFTRVTFASWLYYGAQNLVTAEFPLYLLGPNGGLTARVNRQLELNRCSPNKLGVSCGKEVKKGGTWEVYYLQNLFRCMKSEKILFFDCWTAKTSPAH